MYEHLYEALHFIVALFVGSADQDAALDIERSVAQHCTLTAHCSGKIGRFEGEVLVFSEWSDSGAGLPPESDPCFCVIRSGQ
ncbi:hypothetical protein [Oceanibacterium hippocampi]|uniref:Uncharacterized protein n=1 Tax=Oceanibacterium hippocampi TaxID=745714 RepID=A0A1Y5TY69_9PROT|nr:hypothetical protein [Oceanibacterium hippocampi]SLN76288.1 hypothetical protein OCH7691_04091 [Oceanibacterium hippocampi]